MSGVTGYEKFLKDLSQTARETAAEVHQWGIRKTLERVVLITQHSSSNAAFNWRVVPVGGVPNYVDFHGISPVGDNYDLRSVTGDGAAIDAVVIASLDRENRNVIDQNFLNPVMISNPLDELGNSKYISNAKLSFVRENIEAFFKELEFEVFREIKESSHGTYSNAIE